MEYRVKTSNSGAVPAYEKIARQIKACIYDGTYSYGSALPSEPKLCEEYDVSRITVRRAISELVSAGYLEKVHGKGTFVKHKRYDQELVNLHGFTEAFSKQGITVMHHIIDENIVTPDAITRRQLNLDDSTRVLKLTRLHYLDNDPFSLDTSYFSESLFQGLFDRLREEDSLYTVIREHYGISPLHAERTITVTTPNEAECGLLECEITEPLFKMEKIVLDHEKAIHKSVLLTPSSRVSLKLKM